MNRDIFRMNDIARAASEENTYLLSVNKLLIVVSWNDTNYDFLHILRYFLERIQAGNS